MRPMPDENVGLLRFVACGSVDDGKSTLIGRLLYDANQIPVDQLAAVESASRTWGSRPGETDFSLVTDGLAAEREQGITIDVAYRYFATPRRKFIVADTPGHEQYTRNMATGASTADLAVILADARKGVVAQTRRHAYLVRLLGIRHAVLAVNKMDLIDYDRSTFDAIADAFTAYAQRIGLQCTVPVPIVAPTGENLLVRSTRMDWYAGPTLVEHLETVDAGDGAPRGTGSLRLPVQWVHRPRPDFRGYAGTIAHGTVHVGDELIVQPSGRRTAVDRIFEAGVERADAVAGQAVILTLRDDVDVARGDVLCATDEPLEVADQFDATLVWMGDAPMLPGRRYAMKLATAGATATITELKHKVNVSTLEQLAAKTLQMNEIGACKISLDRVVAFEAYSRSRALGGFILVDPISNDTVAAGMLERALRRAHNIHWQAVDVDRVARGEMKQQAPTVIWFTGLSGAGKSTIANLLERRLFAMGRHTYLLDGDNVRHGLCRDLGFSDADRVENIRRIAEVAKLMADAGLIVLAAFISPFRAERAVARQLVPDGEFVEEYVDAPLDVVESRDVKGLYRKARRGEISNFTGVNSPYEPPLEPDLHLRTHEQTTEAAVDAIVDWLREHCRL